MNTGAACLFLGYRLLAGHPARAAFKRMAWSELRQTFKRYDRFPKYSTFEALCNSAAIHLPVIMIAALAAPKEAGYLMLATYVMQAPMALVGAAVGQVYLAGAANKHRQGLLGEFTAEVLGGLLKTGTGPLLAVGIVSPAVFGLIFGAGWERAGVLVAWMTPWFVLQFLSTPISMGLHVTGHQRLAFALQLFGLALRVSMVWLAVSLSPAHISEWYAVSGFLFYLLYLLTILWRTGLDWRRFLDRAGVPCRWVCSGSPWLPRSSSWWPRSGPRPRRLSARAGPSSAAADRHARASAGRCPDAGRRFAHSGPPP